MTTLHHLLAMTRLELGDLEVLNQQWSDDTLTHALHHALDLYSHAAPRQLKSDLTAPGGTRDLDLAALAGRVGVEAVEYPTGRYPAAYAPYSLWGDTLTLLVETAPAAGETVTVYWTGLHTLDEAGGSLPAAAERLVATGAAAAAALQQAAVAANRLNPGGEAAADRFLVWGNARMAEFERGLAGRRRKQGLLPRRLYTPAGAQPATLSHLEV
jgi:hypothetical protein